MLFSGDSFQQNPLILAPLAGYNDLPFRLLCREHGAALCVSEMISCHGLVYQQPRTLELLKTCPEERPVSFQLFGAEPAVMGAAAACFDPHEIDCVDINMGCPVKKVTKRGAGAALMTDISRAEGIVRAVVANCSCPVTVKLRAGPDHRHLNVVEFARMAQDNGAAAVAVHGRTWKQGFSGVADWSIIKKVKETLTIPVIGNGDITNRAQALDHLSIYGCDAVMIGRAALGNPWVFSTDGRPAHIGGVFPAVRRHLVLLARHTNEKSRSLASIKNHLGKYFKGYPGSSVLRRRLYETRTWSALEELIEAHETFPDLNRK